MSLFRSLRFKTLAWLFLLLLGIGVISFVAGNFLIDRSLRVFEEDMARERVARITQGIEQSLRGLQSYTQDYAQWDDSFAYMQQLPDVAVASNVTLDNQTYLKTNYAASALDNMKVDLVVFLDTQGKPRLVVDGREGEPAARTVPPPNLLTALSPFQTSDTVKTKTGYYLTRLGETPLAVAYAAITPSEAKGDSPDIGWLAMARLLDEEGMEHLRHLTGTRLELLAADTQTGHARAAPAGYLTTPLRDSMGTSPFVMAVDPPPSLAAQRDTSRQMLAWHTTLMVVFASLVAMLLLDRMILRRLGLFSRLAETHLANAQEPATKWPVRGSDELDTLASSLNNMVESLMEAKRKLSADQDQLLNIQQRLENANRLKDNFLATVSHELRTPMNGIVGAQELLKTTQTTDYQRECLDTLTDSSALMSSMVERILLFSELQSGTIRLQPKVTHLAQWAERMKKIWATIFTDKPVTFQVVCENITSEWINVDVVKLDQFVQELLRNAEKFTQQGRVTVTLSETTTESRQALVVDIQDTGIGIPRHQQEAVRDMFRQTTARYARSNSGLGIGLAITREVIRILEGEWQLNSEEGVGTHIRARIPITLAEAPAQPEPVAPPPKAASEAEPPRVPGRVLLVEDNPVNQKIMMKILDMLGCRYQLAVNGQEAVDYAQQETFAIILMDCQMPVMDGLEATRIIRQTGNPNQHTPIIAITANVSDLDRDNCMSVGMNDYLPKPVKPKQIHEAIQHWASPEGGGPATRNHDTSAPVWEELSAPTGGHKIFSPYRSRQSPDLEALFLATTDAVPWIVL